MSSGVPMLRGGDIKAGRISTDVPLITHEKDAEYARTRLEADDVVVALVGYPGESAIVPPRLASANISRAVGLLRLSGGLRPDYLVHFLNSSMGRSEFLRPGAGSAQMVVNLKDLNKLEVPCPPTVKEQEAIAEALSDADALIEGLERLIAKKRLIKQGAMQDLLTAKRRLPGFSGEWVKCKLGAMLSVRHGRSQKDVESPSGQYPILATGGQIGTANSYLCKRPSVLIGRKGTIDRPQFVEQPFWTVDTLFYTDIHAPNDPRFLFYVFQRIDWQSYNEASGVPSLNAKTIENIGVVVPSAIEQVAVSGVLKDMDAEIQALEARLDKARQVKEGMMQNLLTGRIRLI